MHDDMRRLLLLAMLLAIACLYGHAQSPDNYPPDDTTVVIDSTNLPIVWIDVDGAMIDREERIGGRMKIIHNGPGRLNYGDTVAHPGQRVDYEGYIALRYRGNSSYNLSDKKPYSFRTLSKPLEEGYDKKKVPILGMGKDNNWALLAPYSDRSMIRDLLAFEIARPWMEYSPQGRLCELYLDGIYYGVYVLSEVISGGKHRLNLDDPGEEGDALTGGYIMEVDNNDDTTYVSKYHPVDNNGYYYNDSYIRFQYKSPDFEDMTPAQREYITSRIDSMEALFAAPYFRHENGYRLLVDVENFIDYQLVQELGHNVDAYRLSAKLYKRRDSIDRRFKLAIWDMNLAFGNCRHNRGYYTNTWMYRLNPYLHQNGDYMIPFWWFKVSVDNAYVAQRNARWAQWRENNVRMDRLMATIDSLTSEVTRCGAEARNSQAWPRWGVWLWPNKYVATDYADEIAYLKQWITDRVAWMDDQMGYEAPPLPPPAPVSGDVNGDGQVNIADVNLLINIILAGSEDGYDPEATDVNGDHETNIADVMVLINIIIYG